MSVDENASKVFICHSTINNRASKIVTKGARIFHLENYLKLLYIVVGYVFSALECWFVWHLAIFIHNILYNLPALIWYFSKSHCFVCEVEERDFHSWMVQRNTFEWVIFLSYSNQLKEANLESFIKLLVCYWNRLCSLIYVWIKINFNSTLFRSSDFSSIYHINFSISCKTENRFFFQKRKKLLLQLHVLLVMENDFDITTVKGQFFSGIGKDGCGSGRIRLRAITSLVNAKSSCNGSIRRI